MKKTGIDDRKGEKRSMIKKEEEDSDKNEGNRTNQAFC